MSHSARPSFLDETLICESQCQTTKVDYGLSIDRREVLHVHRFQLRGMYNEASKKFLSDQQRILLTDRR